MKKKLPRKVIVIKMTVDLPIDASLTTLSSDEVQSLADARKQYLIAYLAYLEKTPFKGLIRGVTISKHNFLHACMCTSEASVNRRRAYCDLWYAISKRPATEFGGPAIILPKAGTRAKMFQDHMGQLLTVKIDAVRILT